MPNVVKNQNYFFCFAKKMLLKYTKKYTTKYLKYLYLENKMIQMYASLQNEERFSNEMFICNVKILIWLCHVTMVF